MSLQSNPDGKPSCSCRVLGSMTCAIRDIRGMYCFWASKSLQVEVTTMAVGVRVVAIWPARVQCLTQLSGGPHGGVLGGEKHSDNPAMCWQQPETPGARVDDSAGGPRIAHRIPGTQRIVSQAAGDGRWQRRGRRADGGC